jgi:hypothetical protein
MIRPVPIEQAEITRMAKNVKRAPFSRRVKNSTEIFYEWAGYIKTSALQPLFAVCASTKPVVVTEKGEPVCQLARELLLRIPGTIPIPGTILMSRMVLARLTVLAALAVSFAGVTIVQSAPLTGWQEKQQPKTGSAKTDQKAKASSLTGCVDQQEGRYILVDDHGLNKIADLEAEGFPTEGFAKHVGHKVTVRGISSTSGTVPTFKVRTVETISETCAPQQSQGKDH